MLGKPGIRMAIDAAMAVAFVAAMATALVQEVPHECLGTALFALVLAHIIVHRRWFTRLVRGRYDAVRVLQLAVVLGLLVCFAGQVASSIALSEYVLWWLPAVPGAWWARRVHMLCSHWGFVLTFAHAGLQFRTALARMGLNREPERPAAWAWRIALAAVACFGAWSFAALELPAYLSGQVESAFVDQEAPLALAFAQWASVGVLVAGAFHCLESLLRRGGKSEGGKTRQGDGR